MTKWQGGVLCSCIMFLTNITCAVDWALKSNCLSVVVSDWALKSNRLSVVVSDWALKSSCLSVVVSDWVLTSDL